MLPDLTERVAESAGRPYIRMFRPDARLLLQTEAEVTRPRSDPSPEDADFNDEDAAVIAIAAEEDAIDRAAGEDIPFPVIEDADFGDAGLEDATSVSRSGSLAASLAGAPAMVLNPTFTGPPASPHIAMTRRAAAAAAAEAAAAAGGVQRPGIVGGASVSLRTGGETSSAESDGATFFCRSLWPVTRLRPAGARRLRSTHGT